MFCWLGSSKRQIDKYTSLYRGIGNFDIVTVKVSPWQVMWPGSVKGAQVCLQLIINLNTINFHYFYFYEKTGRH